MAAARVTVVPTLAAMAEVYRLPREGGPESARFRAYMRLIEARERDGFQAFNPMAGAAALATVERLLELAAEEVAADAAAAVLERCEVAAPVALALVVASPGMWTDRLVTEADRRLSPTRGTPAQVQLWAGEPAERDGVARAAAAEAVRTAWEGIHGPAADLATVLVREGLADALAGAPPEPLDPVARAATADAVAVLGASRERADVLGVGYGDPLADALGWRAPGVAARGGCRLAAECAARWVAELGAPRALREPPAALAGDLA